MLSIIAFAGLLLTVCACGRRFERALAPVWCLWMLLTVLAATRSLALWDWACGALLAAELVALGVCLARGKGRALGRRIAHNLLTPGLLVFALLTAFLCWACRPLSVWWGDDLFYWALAPKQLWYFGGLLDGSHTLAPYFGTYTPGMALMQWQGMRICGEWNEGVLYIVLFQSYAVFLLPLCERLRWKRAYLAPVYAAGLLALPAACNMLSYDFLCVDTALAACFAFVLMELSRFAKPEKRPLERAALCLTLTALFLLKSSGALLCVLALGYMLLLRKGERRSLWPCWLAPLCVGGLWALYCHLNGLTGYHTGSMTQALDEMLRGAWALPEYAERLPGTLWAALTGVIVPSPKQVTALPLLALPKLCWLALLCALPLALGLCGAYRRSDMRRLSLFTLCAALCYLAGIALSLLTMFAIELGVYTEPGTDNLLVLLMRYLAPLMLGAGAVELQCLTDFPALRKAGRALPAACAAAVVLFLTLCTPWVSMADFLLPDRTAERDELISVAAKTAEPNFWADGVDESERAGCTVMIDFSNDAEFMESLSYTFAPMRVVKAPSGCNDSEILTQQLARYDVDYIVCLDDACPLYEGACQLAEDGWLDTYSLYAVETDEEGPILRYYY